MQQTKKVILKTLGTSVIKSPMSRPCLIETTDLFSCNGPINIKMLSDMQGHRENTSNNKTFKHSN